MNDMLLVQDFFNKEFNFDKLVADTTEYIKNILKNSEDEFFIDYAKNEQEILELRKMNIQYNSTQLNINNEGSKPTFTLKYNLYKSLDDSPSYTYEVEYNCYGEFLDEYFLEY